MKRVLVAGVLSGLLVLATPTLASSADRHDNGGGRQGHSSDNRGGHDRHDSDHRGYGHDRDGRYRDGRYSDGRYGYYYGYPGYYDGYYGGYDDCYHDPSGYTTCEPYGGDYDPGGYNGGYPDPPPDPQYCSQPHSAHSARCPGDPR
jgi:hypothetical protein